MDKIYKVVVIDDSPFITKMVKRSLENNGYEVVGSAQNGFKGIEIFKELRPDLVTLDLTMPDLDGVETLRKLQDIDKNINVIIMTATDYDDMKDDLEKLGAKYFIAKPFETQELLELANNTINGKT